MDTTVKLVSLGIRFSAADKLALAASGCGLQQYDAPRDFDAALLSAGEAEAVCVSSVWARYLPPGFLGRLGRCRLLVVGGGAERLDVDDAALRGI